MNPSRILLSMIENGKKKIKLKNLINEIEYFKNRLTQTTISQEELEVSVIESLYPTAPSACLFMDKNPHVKRDTEKKREQRCCRVTCKRITFLLTKIFIKQDMNIKCHITYM